MIAVKVEDIKIRIGSCSEIGMGDKRVRESNGSIEQTKVKYIHSRNTLTNPLEHQLKY
jgi:hypothetical protein